MKKHIQEKLLKLRRAEVCGIWNKIHLIPTLSQLSKMETPDWNSQEQRGLPPPPPPNS